MRNVVPAVTHINCDLCGAHTEFSEFSPPTALWTTVVVYPPPLEGSGKLDLCPTCRKAYFESVESLRSATPKRQGQESAKLKRPKRPIKNRGRS